MIDAIIVPYLSIAPGPRSNPFFRKLSKYSYLQHELNTTSAELLDDAPALSDDKGCQSAGAAKSREMQAFEKRT
jgi:hypothetical protein